MFQLSTLHFWHQISLPRSLRIPPGGNTLSEFADQIADDFAQNFVQVETGLYGNREERRTMENQLYQIIVEILCKENVLSKDGKDAILIMILATLTVDKIGENNNIYVKCFNGANIKDMHSYAKPTIERKPNLIILHIGTNDLAQRRNEEEKSAVQIAHELIELANEMRMNDTEVVISGLVPRGDDFETKRKRVNLILADLCSENYYAFIEHTNIDASKQLNQSLIHLNRTGANLFESNLIRALRY